MHYKIIRMDVRSIVAFREPSFDLPTKAVEVLAGFYKALHPRYAIELKDLQTSGGTSFGDVKLTVAALGGRARVELTPMVMTSDLQNLEGNSEYQNLLCDFMSIAEERLKSSLSSVVLQQRFIRAVAWLKIDEGKEDALRLLKERGDAALELEGGQYKDWSRSYSLGVNLADGKGRELNVLLEPSGYPDVSDLFARGDYIITDRGEGLREVSDELESAFAEFEGFLKHIGLEASIA